MARPGLPDPGWVVARAEKPSPYRRGRRKRTCCYYRIYVLICQGGNLPPLCFPHFEGQKWGALDRAPKRRGEEEDLTGFKRLFNLLSDVLKPVRSGWGGDFEGWVRVESVHTLTSDRGKPRFTHRYLALRFFIGAHQSMLYLCYLFLSLGIEGGCLPVNVRRGWTRKNSGCGRSFYEARYHCENYCAGCVGYNCFGFGLHHARVTWPNDCDTRAAFRHLH